MTHGSTKLMYEQCKATRNATWQTFYIAIATIYKLDLQSVLTAVMFENKLKCRNTSKQENFILKYLSVNKPTHENTLFSLAVFSTENL
jgi:hypothetical protein